MASSSRSTRPWMGTLIMVSYAREIGDLMAFSTTLVPFCVMIHMNLFYMRTSKPQSMTW